MTKRKTAVDPDQLARQAENGRERPNTHTFSNGRVVTLNRLSEAVLVGLMSESGKPTPPKRVVEMAGGGVMRLDRAEDEPLLSEAEIEAIKDSEKRDEERAYRQYRLDLQRWEMINTMRFARTLFLAGVVDGPDADESELWRVIGWEGYDIKYFWLASLCTDAEEWGNFIEAIVSFSMPTEEGIDEMTDIFRSTVEKPPQQTVAANLDVGTGAEAQPAEQKA